MGLQPAPCSMADNDGAPTRALLRLPLLCSLLLICSYVLELADPAAYGPSPPPVSGTLIELIAAFLKFRLVCVTDSAMVFHVRTVSALYRSAVLCRSLSLRCPRSSAPLRSRSSLLLASLLSPFTLLHSLPALPYACDMLYPQVRSLQLNRNLAMPRFLLDDLPATCLSLYILLAFPHHASAASLSLLLLSIGYSLFAFMYHTCRSLSGTLACMHAFAPLDLA